MPDVTLTLPLDVALGLHILMRWAAEEAEEDALEARLEIEGAPPSYQHLLSSLANLDIERLKTANAVLAALDAVLPPEVS